MQKLIKQLYYSTNNVNIKTFYIVKHKQNKVKKIKKNYTVSLFTIYKKLYKHNFKTVTLKKLSTLNKTYTYNTYYSTYKSILCKSFKHTFTV